MTRDQARVLRALVRWMDANGGATPSYRALGHAVGLAHSRVHTHLRLLERDGWIRRDSAPNHVLAVTVLRRPPPACGDQARVYLASPYTHRRDRPVAESEAREAAGLLMQYGLSAFSPVAYGADVARSSPMIRDRWAHEDWMRWGLPWLHAADAVVVLCAHGWDTSEGVRQEIDHAEALGLPVVYWPTDKMSACEVADVVNGMLRGRLGRAPATEREVAA